LNKFNQSLTGGDGAAEAKGLRCYRG